MADKTIKLKIVEHLAGEAYSSLQEAHHECKELLNKFPNRSDGIGLDLCCLLEDIEKAMKFTELLK